MKIEIIQRFCRKYHIELSSREIDALAAITEIRSFSKDTTIVDMRQTCRSMYFVDQGLLRLYYYKDGRDVTEHFACEEDLVFCIESLFLRCRTELAIKSITDCRLLQIDYAALKSLTDYWPGINHLLQAIFEYDLIISQHKADSWRFETARERYDRFCREYPQAARFASVGDIASYLLMAPETLSRVRAGV